MKRTLYGLILLATTLVAIFALTTGSAVAQVPPGVVVDSIAAANDWTNVFPFRSHHVVGDPKTGRMTLISGTGANYGSLTGYSSLLGSSGASSSCARTRLPSTPTGRRSRASISAGTPRACQAPLSSGTRSTARMTPRWSSGCCRISIRRGWRARPPDRKDSARSVFFVQRPC